MKGFYLNVMRVGGEVWESYCDVKDLRYVQRNLDAIIQHTCSPFLSHDIWQSWRWLYCLGTLLVPCWLYPLVLINWIDYDQMYLQQVYPSCLPFRHSVFKPHFVLFHGSQRYQSMILGRFSCCFRQIELLHKSFLINLTLLINSISDWASLWWKMTITI